jgi:hypothetical protein
MDCSDGLPGDHYRAYGWPATALPNFEGEPDAVPMNSERATDARKKQFTLLVIVAALLKKASIDRRKYTWVSEVKAAITDLGADMTEQTIMKALNNIDVQAIAKALIDMDHAVERRSR